MKEFDEYKPIREKFETFEAQAPDFDSLFEGEVLGNAPLRQLYQTKLSNVEVPAPAFDDLFAGQAFLTQVPKKRVFPFWIVAGTAAACCALMLLFPKKSFVEQQPFSKNEPIEVKKPSYKVHQSEFKIRKEDLLTQKMESPKTIQTLAINHPELKARESLNTFEEVEQTTTEGDSRKINPTRKSDLAVTYERSVEEAYAAAKVKKTRAKREKMTLGTNLNSANRLLSQVNTKSPGSYPLQGLSNQYSAGYSSLQGTSSSLLRSTTINRNDWEKPENISSEILNDYDATYSLPFSVGFSVSFPFVRNFEIMTGLNYTYLSGKISGKTENVSFNLKQELHYIGLPIKISVNFLKVGNFGAYASVGGTIEKGLAGIQNCHVEQTNSVSDWENKQTIHGLQSSLTGQLGVYYELSKTFNLYFEPGISYYTPGDQPISSRTEEPFNFNLGVGLRYRIK